MNNIKVIDKLSFANPQTERCVLCLCMKDYEYFLEVSSQVSEVDFLYKNHAEVFTVFMALSEEGVKEFDIHTIFAKAESLGIFSAKDTFKYLLAVKEMNVSEDNLSAHISELLDRSYKYKLYITLSALKEDVGSSAALSGGDSSFEYLASTAEKQLLDLSVDIKKTDDAELLTSGLADRLEELREKHDIVTGLPSSMKSLDRCLRGFNNGSLYVVAARAGEGKSTLLMNWALEIAVNQGLPILYLDTEMTKTEIQTRALSKLSGVLEESILSGEYADMGDLRKRVLGAADMIGICPYYHKYTPRFDIQEIRRLAKKYKVKKDIKCLFFDYMKMNEIHESLSETQYLGLLATTLKDLAGELDIPVITAAQLGRSAENAKYASASYVGESDRILRYANVLMTLMPKRGDEIEKAGGKEVCGTHRLQVLKNRSGRTLYEGVDLWFKKPVLTFTQANMQSERAIFEQKQQGLGNDFDLLGGL